MLEAKQQEKEKTAGSSKQVAPTPLNRCDAREHSGKHLIIYCSSDSITFVAPATPLFDEMEYEGDYMLLWYADIATLTIFVIQKTRREIIKITLVPRPH
jgi:hypothetical protein